MYIQLIKTRLYLVELQLQQDQARHPVGTKDPFGKGIGGQYKSTDKSGSTISTTEQNILPKGRSVQQNQEDANEITEKIKEILDVSGQTFTAITKQIKDFVLKITEEGSSVVSEIMSGPYSLFVKETLVDDGKDDQRIKKYNLSPELIDNYVKDKPDKNGTRDELMAYLRELDELGSNNPRKQGIIDEELARSISYRLYDPKDDSNPFTVASLTYLKKHNMRVSHYIDNRETGLTAYGIQSTAGKESQLIFRGSDDSADWKNSIIDKVKSGFKWGGFTQFQKNRDEIKKTLLELKKENKPIKVSGHSLGGLLAQITVSEFPELLSNCTTYNSPGIDEETLGKYIEATQKLKEERKPVPVVKHIAVQGDIVSYIGGDKFIPGSVDFYKLESRHNLLDPHMKATFKGSSKIETPVFFAEAMDINQFLKQI